MVENLRFKRKVMLIGNPAVGKTSLVRKFVLDSFSDKYISTVGFKVMKKTLLFTDNSSNNLELNLLIWDLMGQMECRLIPPVAYQSAHGAIIVCDITRKETYANLMYLTTSLFDIIPKIPLIYLANKNDLIENIEISDEEMSDIATRFGSPYLKTSAKTGENVELAFRLMGKRVLAEQGIVTR
jgi:small GTP-binding protein